MKTISAIELTGPELVSLVEYANDMLATSGTYPVEFGLERDGEEIEVDHVSLALAMKDMGFHKVFERITYLEMDPCYR